MRFRVSFGPLAAIFLLTTASVSYAADLRVGNPDVLPPMESPAPLATFTGSIDTLNLGAVPFMGFGVSPSSPVMPAGNPALNQIYGFSGEYSGQMYGAAVGMFSEMAERATLVSAPSAAWTFGGSVGAKGFYVRGGLMSAPAFGSLVQRTEGWQAGFGFATGALDLHLSYLTSQTGSFGSSDRELDSQQWILGGNYRLTSTLRLNADAFYGLRDSRGLIYFTPQSAAGNQAPQGTGARVGIQLRF